MYRSASAQVSDAEIGGKPPATSNGCAWRLEMDRTSVAGVVQLPVRHRSARLRTPPTTAGRVRGRVLPTRTRKCMTALPRAHDATQTPAHNGELENSAGLDQAHERKVAACNGSASR